MNDQVQEEPAILEIIGGRLEGQVNTSNHQLLENMRHAVRQQHAQVSLGQLQYERIAIVGSGVSLKSTEDELRELIFEGAKVVTLNGAYQWCLERNIRPSVQIVMDARPSNARFLKPYIKTCFYMLASQCHADSWAVVKDYERVRIFHACNPDDLGNESEALLNDYYGAGHWVGIFGGTTVATRAIGLMRTLGYLRFDLFGIDSCWMEGEHHAFNQPENKRDKPIKVAVKSADDKDDGRVFVCSPWMIKQFEDFLQIIRAGGHQFLLNAHGNGLIAYTIARNGDVTYEEK